VQHYRQVELEPFGNSQYRRVVVPDGGILGIGKGQDDCFVHVVDDFIDDPYAERPTGLAGSERQRPADGCVVARGNGRPVDRSIADCDNKGRGHTNVTVIVALPTLSTTEYEGCYVVSFNYIPG
jgi:hypothetical protein